ncbi:hypothetical protein DI09_18p170 [Mitosporidium daphniae]|uniref:Uncharacterized protein n=1 Tax=Mitosporidium daphniae TaxID=1485682 RepID=A0A098VX32_9MICR|nr:uncharacterized protein DI09_18p170 [Mitosporidium daphniae]KGG52311.1 hypothetical protein DI09_18p170 [Mitosporidium daphniae]|eukprot:XP_013238738.1 uncharacterized protein DI09_18p170 [Mitosporidium daphniae]
MANAFEARIVKAKDTLCDAELSEELNDKKSPREVIISIYEKRANDLGEDVLVWVDYYQYCLKEGFSGYEALQDISHRALEFHPTNVYLWILQIELIELRSKLTFDLAMITKVIDKLSDVYSTPDLISSLITTYDAVVDLLIRMSNRKVFSLETAISYIDKMIELKRFRMPSADPHSKPIADGISFPYGSSALFSAHSPSFYQLEKRKIWLLLAQKGAPCMVDVSHIRTLFEDTILRCKRESKSITTWLDYIGMERYSSFLYHNFRVYDPNNQKIRSLYKRAISNVESADKEKLVSEWVNWERTFGDDLELLIDCRCRVLADRQKERKSQKRKSDRENQDKFKKAAHQDEGKRPPLLEFRDHQKGPASHEKNADQETHDDQKTHDAEQTHKDHVESTLPKHRGDHEPSALMDVETQHSPDGKQGIYTAFLSNLPFSMEKPQLISFLNSVLPCPFTTIGARHCLDKGSQACMQSKRVVQRICIFGSLGQGRVRAHLGKRPGSVYEKTIVYINPQRKAQAGTKKKVY